MKLSVFKYRFPFKEDFLSAKGNLHIREGNYLQLRKDGITALGEAAPVPGFSSYSTLDITKQLRSKKNKIINFFSRDFALAAAVQFIKQEQLIPPLQFCLYTLAATLLSQKKRLSLHHLLFDKPQNSIPINGLIGLNDNTKHYHIELEKYHTLKLKIDKEWQSIIPLLKNINEACPDLKICIDANQSLRFKEAKKCLQTMELYNIEYFEEPLSNPDMESLLKLQEGTNIPLALDDSINKNFTIDKAIASAPVVIIKPMVLGLSSFDHSISRKAAKHGTKLVFTTSLESGVGRLMTASLAAGFGSKSTAHGLATGNLLELDVWKDDVFINSGFFKLPDANTLALLMDSDFRDLPIEHICTYD